jgi:hypothetical protein
MSLSNDPWEEFLRELASGVPVPEALSAAKITSKEIDAICRDPGQADRFFEACTIAKRRSWTTWQFDDLCALVARGTPVNEAVEQVRGADHTAELFELLELDSAWNARFTAAERAAARVMSLELKGIADDDSKDTLSGPKGEIPNMAAVQRARTRLETRQWLMARADPQRWSERKGDVNVSVTVNYAEQLEAARERAKSRGKITREEKAAAMEATFVPVRQAARPAAEVPPTPHPASQTPDIPTVESASLASLDD